MFRTMVAIKGESKGLPLVGPATKTEAMTVDRYISITKCNHGDTGVTVTAESIVSTYWNS